MVWGVYHGGMTSGPCVMRDTALYRDDRLQVGELPMGLDVGVVNIRYLDQPQEPVYTFLNELLNEAALGLDAEEDDEFVWDASWAGNGLVEFDQGYLERRITAWADANSIDAAGRAKFADWVSALPWKDNGIIMLHLSR